MLGIDFLPASLYRLLPLFYIGAGALTLYYLPNVMGYISGLLLIAAGVLVFLWRHKHVAEQRRQNAARQQKLQSAERRRDKSYARPK